MKKRFLCAVVLALACGAFCFAADVKIPKRNDVVPQTIDTKGKKSEDTEKKPSPGAASSEEDEYGDYGYDDYGDYGYDGYDDYDTQDDDFFDEENIDLEEMKYNPLLGTGDTLEYAMQWSEKDMAADEREMLRLINRFRSGSSAWYSSAYGNGREILVGRLDKLKANLDLYTIAKWRAWELTKSYSYTRPDGGDYCSAFDDLEIDYYCCSEIICASRADVSEVLAVWMATGNGYDDQFHRRQLLGDFTDVGIYHMHKEDSDYKDYWVVVFCRYN